MKSAPDATARAIQALRDLIMRHQLSPDQQIRQEELADRLGLSRSPLREALRALETEGLVRHSPNQGYFVVRLSASELTQVYLMRRLLETEVLRTVRRPNTRELSILRAHDAAVAAATGDSSLTGMLVENRNFHFALFDLSPLDFVTRQVERLWNLSESYRATYLWLHESRARVVHEHAAMIEALSDFEIDRLVKVADRHRWAAEQSVLGMLAEQAM